MESLLIVDDEVIIADGLYHMLQEVFQDRLEVRRCYSCDEACAVLNRNRVDILLTDIEHIMRVLIYKHLRTARHLCNHIFLSASLF